MAKLTPKTMEKLLDARNDPIAFIELAWGLKPQPLLDKYKDVPWQEWEAHHFGHKTVGIVHGRYGKQDYITWEFPTFIKGVHLTWQQAKVIYAIREEFMTQSDPKIKLSISSGRGIGKTNLTAMLIIWSVYRDDATRGMATANSETQLDTVLWAELKKMTADIKQPFLKKCISITSGKISFDRGPQLPASFLSARVAKPENVDSVAGIHSDFVVLVAEEASGIDHSILTTLDKGLTDRTFLFILISQYRYVSGFFHDSQTIAKERYSTFRMNTEESPIANTSGTLDTLMSDGRDSDKYRVEVLGLPPKADSIDKHGWSQLIPREMIEKACTDDPYIVPSVMGVDPSGHGSDATEVCIRDPFKIKVEFSEDKSTDLSIASGMVRALTLYDSIRKKSIYIDNIGVGANVSATVRDISNKYKPQGIDVGRDRRFNKSKYFNLRACLYWRLKEFIYAGGRLYGTFDTWMDLATIRFRVNDKGQIQILPKDQMKKLYGDESPNKADAAALTFMEDAFSNSQERRKKKVNFSSMGR